MKKLEKISLILGIIAITTSILLLPKIKIKSECKGDEIDDYTVRCDKERVNGAYTNGLVPMMPFDCRNYRKEIDIVIGLNGEEYQNSCYACRDCQKIFYYKKNLLEIIIDKFKNKGL